jgi:hypothetical protein
MRATKLVVQGVILWLLIRKWWIIFLRHIFLVVSQGWLVASEDVDSDKISWAIESFGSFKSSGEDGIFPALLKNGIEILSGPLLKIFTACLALGYIPEA